MARVWTCGFEENNLTVPFSGGATGSPTIVTSPVRSGTYALHLNPTAATQAVSVIYKTGGAALGSIQSFRFALYINALPGARSVIAGWRNALNNYDERVWLETNGVVTLEATVQTGTPTITTSALSIQTWYLIEVQVLLSQAFTGFLEMRLDGTVQGTLTGINTYSNSFSTFELGNTVTGYTYDIYVDDCAWNDDVSSVQNTYPGDGRIAGFVEPASDVAVGFVKSGSSPAATNFGGVNDLPGAFTDATAYNDNQASIKEDRFGITTLPAIIGSTDTMILMHISGRVGSNASGTRNLLFEVWDDGGTKTQGPTCSCSVNGWRSPNATENFFVDLTGKTKSQVQNYNIGYTSTSSNTMRVTTLWANIEYKAGAFVGAYHLTGSGGTLSSVSSGTTLTLGTTPTTGNLVTLVLAMTAGSATVTGLTVKDSANNSYAISTSSPMQTNDATQTLAMFYLLSAPANATATLTISWANGGTGLTIFWFEEEFELSSVTASFDTDAAAANVAASTLVVTPSITPAQVGELLLACCWLSGSTCNGPVAGSNSTIWKGGQTAPISGFMDEYVTTPAARSAIPVNFTYTVAVTQNAMSMAFIITFPAAPGSSDIITLSSPLSLVVA